MKRIFLFLSFCFFTHLQAQVPCNENREDTLIAFPGPPEFTFHSGNSKIKERTTVYKNKIIYTSYHFEDTSQVAAEFFRWSDNQYHFFSYEINGKIKEEGDYMVADHIIYIDTILVPCPVPPYDLYTVVYRYKEMLKTGFWKEYGSRKPDPFLVDYWEGTYKNGKRTGIWKQMSYYYGKEVAAINYDKDSSIYIYQKNMAHTLPVDSARLLLSTRWGQMGCESNHTLRQGLFRCSKIKNKYVYACAESNGPIDMYEFFPDGNFTRASGETCDAYKPGLKNGKWTLTTAGNNLFIEIRFDDTAETWEFMIYYMDREGVMILERIRG